MNASASSSEPASLLWEAPDEGVWELESAHYAGAFPVPLRSESEEAFAEGFRRALAGLGLPLSHLELRCVNGWPYTSVFLHDVPRSSGKPPPEPVLKAMVRLHPGFRKRQKIARAAVSERRPEAFADAWDAERQQWIERILALQGGDLDQMDPDALANQVRAVGELYLDGFTRHFELVPGCLPLGRWLVHARRWGLPMAEARSAVMYGTPVHEAARRRLVRIGAALGATRVRSLDEIRAHSVEAAEALDDYLVHHGWWATEDSLTASAVKDHPEMIIGAIAVHSGEAAAEDHGERDAQLARLRDMVSAEERAQFDQLAADAHRSYMMLDDNSGILASWTGGLAGVTLRAAARRLVDLGRIASADDIWGLEMDEIIGLLEGHSELDVETISVRAEQWRALSDLDPPPYLNGPPSAPPSPDVFPEPVRGLVAAMGAFLEDKFNSEEKAVGIGGEVVTGRAVVTRNASEALERLEPGDILVTTATTPAYNAVLPLVGGLIVTRGGPSAHAAVMARELDIPAIVGLDDALERIPDGALVELDPNTATARVIEPSNPPPATRA